jgi:hypothetical protein
MRQGGKGGIGCERSARRVIRGDAGQRNPAPGFTAEFAVWRVLLGRTVPFMSTDLSGEIAAVATAVLAFFALLTAIFAGLAFSKQRQEVGVLQQEARSRYEKEQRSQAAKVTAWLERQENAGPWEVHVRNDSDLCIFDVRVYFHAIRKQPVEGWEPIFVGERSPREETICVFPPKHSRPVVVPDKIRALFSEFSDRTCVASIEFTDAAERHWERDPRGRLITRSVLVDQGQTHHP